MKFTSAHVVNLAPSPPANATLWLSLLNYNIPASESMFNSDDNNNNYTSGHSTVQGTGWSCKYIVVSARVFNGYTYICEQYIIETNECFRWTLEASVNVRTVSCVVGRLPGQAAVPLYCAGALTSGDAWPHTRTIPYPTCTNSYTWYCTPNTAATNIIVHKLITVATMSEDVVNI